MRTLTVKKDQINLPEEVKREAIHAYYATITFMDAQIGRVLDALDTFGLNENTIIVFSSDHGYHMGEHDHFQKQTLFEDAGRVPLILSAPGMKARGKRTGAIVEMIDFYRTLSELAGLEEPPAYVQGISMAPLLEKPETEPRQSALTRHHEGFSIRTKRYRYTHWPEEEGLNAELYDRLNDPAEMVNLAGDPHYADVQAAMHTIWQSRVEEASTHPEGLPFTPPDPDDNGIGSKEA